MAEKHERRVPWELNRELTDEMHMTAIDVINNHGHWEETSESRAGVASLAAWDFDFKKLPKDLQLLYSLFYNKGYEQTDLELTLGFSAAHLLSGNNEESQLSLSIGQKKSGSFIKITDTLELSLIGNNPKADLFRYIPTGGGSFLGELGTTEAKQGIEALVRKRERGEIAEGEAVRDPYARHLNTRVILLEFMTNSEIAKQLWDLVSQTGVRTYEELGRARDNILNDNSYLRIIAEMSAREALKNQSLNITGAIHVAFNADPEKSLVLRD